MGDTDDFILDPKFADWVWRHIRSSGRLYWPDDKRLTYLINPGSNQEKYIRDGTWDDDVWNDWWQTMGVMGPKMEFTPSTDFRKGTVREVGLAGVSYSNIGSWYTFEMREKVDEDLKYTPLRIPVTREMIEEVREWADDNDGEVQRVKPVSFEERYATALPDTQASKAARQLEDVHVKFEGIDTEEEAKRLFTEATDFAERAVRSAASDYSSFSGP